MVDFRLKNRREPSIDVVSPVGAREVGPTRGEDGEVLQRRLQLRLQRAPGGHAREQPGVPEVRLSSSCYDELKGTIYGSLGELGFQDPDEGAEWSVFKQ